MINQLTIYQLTKLFKYITDIDYINLLKTCKKLNSYYQLRYLTNEYNFADIMNILGKYHFRNIHINSPTYSITLIHGKVKTLDIHLPESVICLKLGYFVGKIKNVRNLKYVQLGNYYIDIDFVNNLLHLPNIVYLACEMMANIILSPLMTYNKYCYDRRIVNKHYSGFDTMKRMSEFIIANLDNELLIEKFMKTCFIKNVKVSTIFNEIKAFRKIQNIYCVIEQILHYIILKVDKVHKKKSVTFGHCDMCITHNFRK